MSIENIRRLKEQAKLPKPKKVYQIPKKSAKKIAMERLQTKVEIVKPKKAKWFDTDKVEDVAVKIVTTKGNAELGRWFIERRKELDGKCHHCGNPSCKNDDKYFKFSICHILPKSIFKSVATNQYNFIELCFWGNNCHENMDSKMLDLIEMNCWDEIVNKFVKIYPSIAKEERRRIPKILLEYIETENK